MELRTSSYIIPVKLEKEKGKYLLIHGYTGAIDVVSEELLAKIESINLVNDLSEDTLQNLLKRGYITVKKQNEEIEYVSRIARALHKKMQLLYKNFTFVVTYNCNFRCPYCFENRRMKDDSSVLSFTRMMVDKAYSAMEEIEPRVELRDKTIALYGGEPLLPQNKNIVKYIIAKGAEKGYTFRVLTNGYNLNCFMDLLSPELIDEIQVTIDGTKEYHNKRRIHYEDNETFDKIISNVDQALKKGVNIIVRVNTDNKNVEDFVRLKAYFEDCGFFSYPTFKMYSALLWDSSSISEEEQHSLDFLSAKLYISKNEEMGIIKQCKDCGLYTRIYQALSENKPIPFRNVFCASQTGGYIFDPLGDIYPCWEIVGNNNYRIGNYRNEKIEWDNGKLDEWHNYDITVNSICKSCKYALFCGGGCVAHALFGRKEQCAYFTTMFKSVVNRAFEKMLNKSFN